MQQAAPGALQALPDMSQLLQPNFGKALAAAGSLSRSNSFCYQEAIAALSQGPESQRNNADAPMGAQVATGTPATPASMLPSHSHQHLASPSSRMAAEAAACHSSAAHGHQQQGDQLLQSPNEGAAGRMDLRRTALLRSLLSKTDEHLLRRRKSEGGADAAAGAAAAEGAAAAADGPKHGADVDHMHTEGVPESAGALHRPDPPPSPVQRHARSCGGALECALAAGQGSHSPAAAAMASEQLAVLAHEQGKEDMDTSDMECSSDDEAETEAGAEQHGGLGSALVDGRYVVPRVASLRRHTCSNDVDLDAEGDCPAEVTKGTLEKLRAKALAGAAQLLQEDVTEPRTERDGGAGRPAGPRGGSRRHSSHI